MGKKATLEFGLQCNIAYLQSANSTKMMCADFYLLLFFNRELDNFSCLPLKHYLKH